jgi:ribosomal protein S18 acetylase RimI-like enzyme
VGLTVHPLADMTTTPVPRGHIAAIVTDLEMRTKPSLRPVPNSPLQLKRWNKPPLGNYRALFARVGSPWLWFSRAIMPDDALNAILQDPLVELFAVVDRAGVEVGILELDFRKVPDCEITFFGLIPELAGQGHGRWLMAETLNRAWRQGIECVWLHTCTLDHPSALSFYQKQGFTPVGREVETFPDPRLSGHLPRDAAPHIPLLS